MALILGTEPTTLSWVTRPKAACELTTPKPTTKDASSTRIHTRAQVRSSTNMKAIPDSDPTVEAELEQVISGVTSLEMVTKDLVEKLQLFCMEIVEFKYLKVSEWEYRHGLDWCDEEYSEITGIFMEYNPKTGTVILNSRGASALHSSCQGVLYSWLREIKASSPEQRLFVFHEQGIIGFNNVPDVILGRYGSRHPIIMVEVGFSETLEEMFNNARELLHISEGATQIVILLKIYEEGRDNLKGYPWGLTETEIQDKAKNLTLVEAVIDWYKQNKVNIVGDLMVHLYIWGAERKQPPRYPIWEFEIDSDTLVGSEGTFRRNLKNPFLDRDFRLKIFGGLFPLPVEQVRIELKEAIEAEVQNRVHGYLCRKGYIDRPRRL